MKARQLKNSIFVKKAIAPTVPLQVISKSPYSAIVFGVAVQRLTIIC
jgi:hypothetical protein